MHPVVKGELGEISVFKEMKTQGLAVFPEMGNNSRVDVIGMDDEGHLYKVQVKCTTSTKGKAVLTLRKQTMDPRYNYKYRRSDVDVYALYIEDRDVVIFISSEEIFKDKDVRTDMTFRIDPPSNGIVKKSHNDYRNYMIFPRARSTAE